ncbi:hypothetical protein A2801_00630 [Candidatus Woesebacteria bacterium RIFCSPHIGHO2_01_FULL_41_10]|uniref:DUF192 domain-containing protein n=1 Tax=Candidatus Woesebacteria bacterium RIFCSPHIGHO2_01_FULL_41_10 TaxID=1802500 RepID=A0A1F7YQT3_9BACT|nr:MAG: hypothetical protein A2801_00630 [Candidatus Woesebacteria bacterium RIFCSPHIGHO2_01_FULL_41_10]
MKKVILVIVVAVIFLIVALSAYKKTSGSSLFSLSSPTPRPMYSLRIGDTNVKIVLAKTPKEITQGLSGADPLAPNEGMLFIFDKPTQPAFWMKDMRFDLDMIWIREGKVVDIHENVPSPDPRASLSSLPLYISKEPADSVLEVSAGFAKTHKIVNGTEVDTAFETIVP